MNDFELRLYDRAAQTVADLGAVVRSVATLRRRHVDGYYLFHRPDPIRRPVRREYRPPASKRAS